MISFVCWKWSPFESVHDSQRLFHSDHVNVLRAMIARHYPMPHRFICITDDPAGLDAGVEALPLPVRFDRLASPSGARFPSCYARLWNFSRAAAAVLGERIFCLDIDVVILRDIRHLVARSEPFVGWCDERFRWNKIAGGAYFMTTGSMPYVWENFDPLTSPTEAFKAGNPGSDQGWMSYCMYPPPGRWNPADGLVKINWTPEGAPSAPADACIVFTSGLSPPWSNETQRKYPWIKSHWRL
jgi:hypothetical protein